MARLGTAHGVGEHGATKLLCTAILLARHCCQGRSSARCMPIIAPRSIAICRVMLLMTEVARFVDVAVNRA